MTATFQPCDCGTHTSARCNEHGWPVCSVCGKKAADVHYCVECAACMVTENI